MVATGMCMAPVGLELLNNCPYYSHVTWQVLGMGWSGRAWTEECGVFGSPDFCSATWLRQTKAWTERLVAHSLYDQLIAQRPC